MVSGFGFRGLDLWLRVWRLGFEVQGLGVGICDLGFGVWGLGWRAQGSGLGADGLGFRERMRDQGFKLGLQRLGLSIRV